jgi:hypothetical protein
MSTGNGNQGNGNQGNGTRAKAAQGNGTQGTAKPNLVIASGDSSDADGFFTIPLYARTGADLLLFINFNAMFDDYNMPATYEGLKGEYDAPSPAEFAIPIEKRVHRGNWIHSFIDKDMENYIKLNESYRKLFVAHFETEKVLPAFY